MCKCFFAEALEDKPAVARLHTLKALTSACPGFNAIVDVTLPPPTLKGRLASAPTCPFPQSGKSWDSAVKEGTVEELEKQKILPLWKEVIWHLQVTKERIWCVVTCVTLRHQVSSWVLTWSQKVDDSCDGFFDDFEIIKDDFFGNEDFSGLRGSS